MTEVCLMICRSFRKYLSLPFGLWSIVLINIKQLLSSYTVCGRYTYIHWFWFGFYSQFPLWLSHPEVMSDSLQPHGRWHARLLCLHHLPKLVQIHVFVLVMLSNHLILCFPVLICLPSFPASGSFPVSQLFTSGGQNIGGSAAVLPMNIHFFAQFSSLTQLCLTLCNHMDFSMSGFPVHHQPPEFIQIHIHWVSDAIQPFHPLSSPSPSNFNLSQHQSLFKWISSSHQVAKVLEFQHQHQPLQWTPRTDLL